MATRSINVTLRVEQRAWAKPAFAFTYCACAAASLASDSLAGAIAATGSRLLARYGFRYIVE